MTWRTIATLTLIAWGAVAFGAVYPWAYVPLLAGCAATGLTGMTMRTGSGGSGRILEASLAALLGAIAIQLIPLPATVLELVSPETGRFLRDYELGYAQSAPRHALSIQASATAVALGIAAALALMLVGLTRALSRDDTRQIVRGVTVLGVILALAGIIQKSLWNGKIYGFWMPMEEGHSFGPFVNRNHFAGWMLMAMPVAVGYLSARVVSGMRGVRPGWRNRVLWFSSSEASQTILVAFAVLMMALALTLTTSRSGIAGLIAAATFSGCFVACRRTAATSRRAALTAYLVFVVFVAVGWAGVDRLAARFSEGDPVTLGNRVGIWADTWQIARRFPVAGTGLNTYGVSTLSYQTVLPEQHLAQAHNDYLQLAAEGGLLVGVPALLVIVAAAHTIRRRFGELPEESSEYWIRMGAVTGVLAVALQEVGEFSLQMPGNAVLFVVLLSIALRPVDSRRPGRERVNGVRESS
jgi:O-antigen ligase